jgi:hypothetical protein
MSSIKYFGPGSTYTSHTTQKIINYQGDKTIGSCACPVQNNKQIKLTSANNSQGQTQNQRIATIINYSNGGRVQYGNSSLVTQPQRVTFLGRTEGQLGGTMGPLRNKF